MRTKKESELSKLVRDCSEKLCSKSSEISNILSELMMLGRREKERLSVRKLGKLEVGSKSHAVNSVQPVEMASVRTSPVFEDSGNPLEVAPKSCVQVVIDPAHVGKESPEVQQQVSPIIQQDISDLSYAQANTELPVNSPLFACGSDNVLSNVIKTRLSLDDSLQKNKGKLKATGIFYLVWGSYLRNQSTRKIYIYLAHYPGIFSLNEMMGLEM